MPAGPSGLLLRTAREARRGTPGPPRPRPRLVERMLALLPVAAVGVCVCISCGHPRRSMLPARAVADRRDTPPAWVGKYSGVMHSALEDIQRSDDEGERAVLLARAARLYAAWDHSQGEHLAREAIATLQHVARMQQSVLDTVRLQTADLLAREMPDLALPLAEQIQDVRARDGALLAVAVALRGREPESAARLRGRLDTPWARCLAALGLSVQTAHLDPRAIAADDLRVALAAARQVEPAGGRAQLLAILGAALYARGHAREWESKLKPELLAALSSFDSAGTRMVFWDACIALAKPVAPPVAADLAQQAEAEANRLSETQEQRAGLLGIALATADPERALRYAREAKDKGLAWLLLLGVLRRVPAGDLTLGKRARSLAAAFLKSSGADLSPARVVPLLREVAKSLPREALSLARRQRGSDIDDSVCAVLEGAACRSSQWTLSHVQELASASRRASIRLLVLDCQAGMALPQNEVAAGICAN